MENPWKRAVCVVKNGKSVLDFKGMGPKYIGLMSILHTLIFINYMTLRHPIISIQQYRQPACFYFFITAHCTVL